METIKSLNLLRPSGKKWTINDYMKRITANMDIAEWRNKYGANWEKEFETMIFESIKHVIPRLYLEIKTETTN